MRNILSVAGKEMRAYFHSPIGYMVLALFAVLGQALFSALGVTSEAFSIAGGALLFLVAIDMLFGRQSGTRETPREARESRTREDVSVFPLAIPMIFAFEAWACRINEERSGDANWWRTAPSTRPPLSSITLVASRSSACPKA